MQVDYQFDTNSGTWHALHSEQHLKNNLSIMLQWSPVATEAELLKQVRIALENKFLFLFML